MRRSSCITAALSLFTATLLAGCSASFAPSPSISSVSLSGIQGTVFGGQQPVNLSHVYVYAAGTSGYGGPSQSLLTAYSTGSFPTTQDANGNYYVTTNIHGFFSLTGEYSCTPGQDVYIYALGGDSGGGSNSAIGLMAVFGTCPAAGTFAGVLAKVQINELSTVAAAYAMSGFAVDATHVADDEAVSGNATAANAQAGMVNAFATAGNLVSLTGGNALTTTPNGNGTVPATTINTLGDILAGCVNSADSTSGTTVSHSPDCQSLFALATSDGTTTGAQPTDTASAAINIAHHPGANTAALYSLSGTFPPFTALSSQPNDFSLSIAYTDPSIVQPNSIAIDASGNIWTANFTSNSIGAVNALGVALPGAPFTAGGTLDSPANIAFDKSGHVWISNYGNSSTSDPGGVAELSSTGSSMAALTGHGLDNPANISIDGLNNVWVANTSTPAGGTGSIVAFTNSGTLISTGSIPANGPDALANDGAGNAFFDDQGDNTAYVFQANSSCTPTLAQQVGDYNIPTSVAIDSHGEAWTANLNDNSITNVGRPTCETGQSTQFASNFTGGGLDYPIGLILDGAANVWVANGPGTISEFNSSGNPITSSNGLTSAALTSPSWIAADASGNLWVPSYPNSTLIEFVGATTPVITPLAAGLPNTLNTTGTSNLATRP